MFCRWVCWIELHDERDGHAVPSFLAGHRFLGLYPDVSKVPRVSAHSVQRAGHVRDRLARGRLYVGVGERGRLEEVQTADHECARCAERRQQAVTIRVSHSASHPNWRIFLKRDEAEI